MPTPAEPSETARARPVGAPATHAARARAARARTARPTRTVPPAAIHYRLTLHDPDAHLLAVELRIATPRSDGQELALPAWIPGSYMIREFARHIIAIDAESGGHAVALVKLDKHTWRAGPCDGPLVVRYQVYAWDLSVRAAHVDRTHAFFNGTSVYLRVVGQDAVPVTVDFVEPTQRPCAGWQVATTLPRAGAPRWGFGRYRAADYDELIDHPVEMGTFTLATFRAAGVDHHVAITGRHDTDTARLVRDLAPVCEAQARLFEPRTGHPPFDEYLFLVMAVGDGYGGLEHRASTALIAARGDLPWRGMTGQPDGYRRFLGLCSHEYFHSWHVKRIKPAAFVPYDLGRENYTRLLWIFEGFTSYYDDLMLARAGVVSRDDYLKGLAATVSGVLRGPGRRLQSVAESSFEAWAKYYRQDEQSPNAIVSYYAKGSLVALCVDLALRERTAGRRGLDDVMRLMWRRYGRDFDTRPDGLAEDALPDLVREATGESLDREIRAWAYGTRELPLAERLAPFGVTLALEAPDEPTWLGARTTQRGADLTIATAYTGGPAHSAGLSAGDVLVAFDGLRVEEKTLRALLSRHAPGDRVPVHVFRRDELHQFELRLQAPPRTEARLTLATPERAAAKRLRRGWLGIAG